MKCLRTGIAVLLTAVLLFSMTACGNTPTDESSALSAGGAFAEYVGLWSESDLSFEKGGFILKISIADDTMTVHCSSNSSLPDSKVAELSKSIELSQIKNNIAEFSYDEDGWGNSGVLELTFSGEYILADFKNVVMDEMASWGFYENTYKLVPNAKAYEILAGSNGDVDTDIVVSDPSYEDEPSDDGYTDVPMYTFPDYDTPNYDTPIYDTSKASGILASMGMTEEEFKASCTPLRGQWIDLQFSYSKWDTDTLERIDNYDYNCGKKYFDEHPNDPIMTDAKAEWEKLTQSWQNNPSDSTYGREYDFTNPSNSYGEHIHLYIKYGNEENFIKEQVYAVEGRRMIRENTNDLFEKMREYPNEYIGQGFVFIDMDDFSASMYSDSYLDISITDIRDDKSNPNILFGKYDYHLYVVFAGSSGETLYFNLVTIEKTREN